MSLAFPILQISVCILILGYLIGATGLNFLLELLSNQDQFDNHVLFLLGVYAMD